jgi:hypothetical protein
MRHASALSNAAAATGPRAADVRSRPSLEWAIQDSNLGPLPYQERACGPDPDLRRPCGSPRLGLRGSETRPTHVGAAEAIFRAETLAFAQTHRCGSAPTTPAERRSHCLRAIVTTRPEPAMPMATFRSPRTKLPSSAVEAPAPEWPAALHMQLTDAANVAAIGENRQSRFRGCLGDHAEVCCDRSLLLVLDPSGTLRRRDRECRWSSKAETRATPAAHGFQGLLRG